MTLIYHSLVDIVIELTDPVGSDKALPAIEALGQLGGKRTLISVSCPKSPGAIIVRI
jgi:hypothetical protein